MVTGNEMKLRSYQQELVQLSFGTGNVLIQADTGAGKTLVIAESVKHSRFALVVAHRNILIKQASKMLARFDIKHDVLATTHTRRLCITEHRKLGLGDSILDSEANTHVASVDSLLSRHRRGLLKLDTLAEWQIFVDEAHHMTDENKWGKLQSIFPNSRIIGYTATPLRLDGISLARGKGGVFDRLAQAEELKKDSVKKLIEWGFLCDFKAYSLPEHINIEYLAMGVNDYTYKSLEKETHRVLYKLCGDAVKHYKKLANGKQALAFCVSIEIAKETAQAFKNAGVSAAAIHSKMSVVEVARIFDLFQQKVIKVLCNVDMIGEGVDVPAIEALIMLRKTASLGLYRQWCGRALRPEKGKDHAILIDHVGNIRTHGLHDEHIDWDIHYPPKAEKSNLVPCRKCSFLVKAWVDTCPECGADIGFGKNTHMPPDELQYINVALVECKRQLLKEGQRKAIKEKQLTEELMIAKKNINDLPGIKKIIHKIKLWFADVLQNDGVSIYDLNVFFEKHENDDFWIAKFTFADLGKNTKKCIKVYEEWHKYN